MKKLIFLAFSFTSFFVFSQDVKLKKDMVIIDGNQCMKYSSRELGTSSTYYSLDGKRLFYIDSAKSKTDETFFKIQFNGSDEIITSPATGFNFKTSFIKNMIEEEVINPKTCEINLDKVKSFKSRYNKDFDKENTTIIINNQEPVRKNGVNISIGT